MRLLVLDEEFPFPLNSGKRLRSFNLIRVLAQRNEVCYLAYGNESSAAANHLRDYNIQPIAVPTQEREQSGVRFYARLLANLASPYPYIVTSHFSGAFQSRLNDLLASEQVDAIICEWTPYAVFVKRVHSTRKIIVAHNIESSIWRRYEHNESNLLKRKYIAHQARKVELFEQNCFGWVDGATAVSAEEARTIGSFGVKYPIAVVENGVDIDYFAPQYTPLDENALVFTGSMDWRPNQDAVLYFASEIFPRIRRLKPQATVSIVGRDPPEKILALDGVPGIHITGTVDDVRPYIARAAVYVVPLRIGGGSRLKILEAAGMKKAIVSTTVGAEGLETVDSESIILRDDPQSFAEAVVDCMETPELRNKLGERARHLVENVYRWEILGEKFDQYLRSVTKES